MVRPFDKAWRLLKAPKPVRTVTPHSSNRMRGLYPQGIGGPRSPPVTPEERAAWAAEDENECPDCGGIGYIEQMVPDTENPNVDPEDPDEWIEVRPTCTTCNGTGKKI